MIGANEIWVVDYEDGSRSWFRDEQGAREQAGATEGSVTRYVPATAEASAQGEAGRWIACEERFPEEGLMVLFWHQDWPIDCNLIGLGRFRLDDDDGSWWEDISEQDMTGDARLYYSGVTHWMPLPTAPLLPPPPKAEP